MLTYINFKLIKINYFVYYLKKKTNTNNKNNNVYKKDCWDIIFKITLYT